MWEDDEDDVRTTAVPQRPPQIVPQRPTQTARPPQEREKRARETEPKGVLERMAALVETDSEAEEETSDTQPGANNSPSSLRKKCKVEVKKTFNWSSDEEDYEEETCNPQPCANKSCASSLRKKSKVEVKKTLRWSSDEEDYEEETCNPQPCANKSCASSLRKKSKVEVKKTLRWSDEEDDREETCNPQPCANEVPFFAHPKYYDPKMEGPFFLGYEESKAAFSKATSEFRNESCSFKDFRTSVDDAEKRAQVPSAAARETGFAEKNADCTAVVARDQSLFDKAVQAIANNPFYFGYSESDVFMKGRPLAVIREVYGNDSPLESRVVSALKQTRRGYYVPRTIARYLFPHQLEGCRFLASVFTGERTLTATEQRGGILAHDMGLGKSIQVCAFLAALFRKTGEKSVDSSRAMQRQRYNAKTPIDASQGPVLLVVPTSVVGQWEEYLKTWGVFDTVNLSDSSLTANDRVNIIESDLRHGLGEVALIGVSTFSAKDTGIVDTLKKVNWRCAIFDEVHNYKTSATVRARAAQFVDAPCKIGLTGTVMSNGLKELWGVMKVISPGTFGSYKIFKRDYAAAIESGRKHQATPSEVRQGLEAQRKLALPLKRLVLIRKKEILKDRLSQKQDLMVLCDLSHKQQVAYNRMLEGPDCQAIRDKTTDLVNNPLWRLQHRVRSELRNTEHIADDDDAAQQKELEELNLTEESAGVDKDSFEPFEAVRHESSEDDSEDEDKRTFLRCKGCKNSGTCLQMPMLVILAGISNHLELIRANPALKQSDRRKDRRTYRDKVRKAKLVLGSQQRYVRTNKLNELVKIDDCGKLQVLFKLLDRWQGRGIKVLIFSNSLVLLDILEIALRNTGWNPSRLDGSTPPSERDRLCRNFNVSSNAFIFLISTAAGGEGLNLVGASKVVIMDPSWNPTKDLQAQDRAYRIGQYKNVKVYRLIAKGTIEEIKFLRQAEKSSLSRVVMEGSAERRIFQAREFRKMEALLSYSPEGFTKQVMERYNREIQVYRKKGTLAPQPKSIFELANDEEDKAGKNFAMIKCLVPLDGGSGADEDSAQSSAAQDDEAKGIDWLDLVSHSNEEAEFQQESLRHLE